MKSVMIGMSGGVDSSVAAAILVEQGYSVTGVTMKLWDDEQKQQETCSYSSSAINDAKRVCEILNIPHFTINYEQEFKQYVIDNFLKEYSIGHTPNPCIACNKHLKFKLLLEKALSLNFDYIATGHYAKCVYNENVNRWQLIMAHACQKDQTYVLYNLTQDQLAHTFFPLGDKFSSKDQVREYAYKLGFALANKPDSQEICFIPDNDYANYINMNLKNACKPGCFVDINGNILGEHKGIINYTIGQRKGLNIALGKPMYVIKINYRDNTVVLSENEQDLFLDKLIAKDVNLISMNSIANQMPVQAKIRYLAKPSNATLTDIGDNKVLVQFENPQRAISPGQSVVFYDNDLMVGGGIIM